MRNFGIKSKVALILLCLSVAAVAWAGAVTTIVRGNYRIRGTVALDAIATPSSLSEGLLWNDSTQKSIIGYLSGVKQSAPGVLFTSTATATVANTTTETTIVGSGVGTATLPANFFVVGKTVRVTVTGVYGTTATPGTLTLKIKVGSLVAAATAANTPTASLTNRGFEMVGVVTCRTTGVTGTVFAQGITTLSSGAATTVQWEMPNSATGTLDTTASALVDATATWATANAANTISGTNVILEALN